ncbi:MAG: hypothetical protein JKY88_05440 [Pseudomonadales bacterium]|nr:hypothetical protein [Pseudomonadales bacterium]
MYRELGVGRATVYKILKEESR